MTARRIQVRVVYVGPTTAAEDRLLFHAAAMTYVVAPLSPLVDSPTRVAGAVLSALGKSAQHAPMGRRSDDEIGLMQDWLVGRAVTTATFHPADRLSAAVLDATATAVIRAGTIPIFVFRTRTGAAKAVRQFRRRSVRWSVTELAAAIGFPARSQPHLDSGMPAPLRVDDDNRLAPNAEWTKAATVVRELLAGAGGAEQRIELVGLAQPRLAAYGWELTPQHLSRLAEPADSMAEWVPPTFRWSSLHEWRGTDQVAAAVLAGLDVSLLELMHLRSDHILPDGSAVAVMEDVIPVPWEARAFLVARRATLEREGRSDDLLLSRPGRRLYKGEIRTMIAAVYGSPVRRADIPLRIEPHGRWLRRHGLALESTAPRGRAAMLYARSGRSDPSHTYRTFHSVWPGRRS